MSVKLKPCPFCGNEGIYVEMHDDWWVHEGLVICRLCGGRMFKQTRRDDGYTVESTRELVINAWNRRAET